MTLNPAGLVLFGDWAQTLPPRPLPRTVIPVPGQYYLDYIGRLADANHLELLELTGALDDPAAVTLDPGSRNQHRQERLAAAAGQPLARVAGLYWDDPGLYGPHALLLIQPDFGRDPPGAELLDHPCPGGIISAATGHS